MSNGDIPISEYRARLSRGAYPLRNPVALDFVSERNLVDHVIQPVEARLGVNREAGVHIRRDQNLYQHILNAAREGETAPVSPLSLQRLNELARRALYAAYIGALTDYKLHNEFDNEKYAVTRRRFTRPAAVRGGDSLRETTRVSDYRMSRNPHTATKWMWGRET